MSEYLFVGIQTYVNGVWGNSDLNAAFNLKENDAHILKYSDIPVIMLV